MAIITNKDCITESLDLQQRVAVLLCRCAGMVALLIGKRITSVVIVFLELDCGFLIISPGLFDSQTTTQIAVMIRNIHLCES